MSRLLIVVQAGAAGSAAIGAGLDLAQTLGRRVVFVQAAVQAVVPMICDPPCPFDVAALHCRQEEERRVEASLASASRSSSQRGVGCEVVAAWGGDPAQRITRAADDLQCDLIVVGALRRSLVGRLLHGNLATELIARSRRPVLVVSAGA